MHRISYFVSILILTNVCLMCSFSCQASDMTLCIRSASDLRFSSLVSFSKDSRHLWVADSLLEGVSIWDLQTKKSTSVSVPRREDRPKWVALKTAHLEPIAFLADRNQQIWKCSRKTLTFSRVTRLNSDVRDIAVNEKRGCLFAILSNNDIKSISINEPVVVTHVASLDGPAVRLDCSCLKAEEGQVRIPSEKCEVFLDALFRVRLRP